MMPPATVLSEAQDFLGFPQPSRGGPLADSPASPSGSAVSATAAAAGTKSVVLMEADPGDARPASEPLYVGHDRAADEYVEFWFQKDKRKDPNVLSNPQKRLGGMFGFGYLVRRSSGAPCHRESGRRKCEKIHLCPCWPCPSDHRKSNGEVDVGKWGGFAPWHMVWCKDGWPPALPGPAAAEPAGTGLAAAVPAAVPAADSPAGLPEGPHTAAADAEGEARAAGAVPACPPHTPPGSNPQSGQREPCGRGSCGHRGSRTRGGTGTGSRRSGAPLNGRRSSGGRACGSFSGGGLGRL